MIILKEKKKIIGSIVLVSMFIFFIFIGYFISKPEKNYKKEDIFVDNTVKGEEKNLLLFMWMVKLKSLECIN